jgi:hypothetical protein
MLFLKTDIARQGAVFGEDSVLDFVIESQFRMKLQTYYPFQPKKESINRLGNFLAVKGEYGKFFYVVLKQLCFVAEYKGNSRWSKT